MSLCPEVKADDNRNSFNELLSRLGGKPMSELDAVKRSEYLASLSKPQTKAYYAAHAYLDQHGADYDSINRHLDTLDRVKAKLKTPSRVVKSEAESRRQAPIAAVVAPRGGAPSGLADWFRNRRSAVSGQFTGLGDPSALASGVTKNVKAGWDKFLNLAVRNLSQLRRASQPAHTAALRAGGSRGQATVLLQLATAKIDDALKGSGITWPMVRAALVESRLRGIRERYLDFAQQALDATDEDLVDALQSGMSEVLSHIEGRAGLDDTLAQRAMALMQGGRMDDLRDFLAGTFEIAADRVGRVGMGPDPNAFEKLTGNPAFKKALTLYKDLIEKPVAESHGINEGVFSDALGPLDTYYPLVAVKDDGGILHRIFGVQKFPYRKPRNIANYFATGLASHGYSLEASDFAERIQAAVRTNNKADLLRELNDQGLIQILGRFQKAPADMYFDGEVVPHELVDTGIDLMIMKDGKETHIPGARAMVPLWLKKELKPILEREGKLEPGMGQSLVNSIIQTALIGPLDFVFHSTNIIGTLTANTPFLGPGFATKTVGNLPMTKWLTGIVKILRENPTSEENIKQMTEMAKLGLVPPRYGSVSTGLTRAGRRYAELTGAKRKYLIAPLIYGPKGIDMRARLVMWKIAKLDTSMTPQQRFDFVAQLGIYNRELESQIERWAKATRLAPFATAGMAMYRNGVNAWLGITGPIPAGGGDGPSGPIEGGGGGGISGGGGGEEPGDTPGRVKRSGYRLAQMLSGGAIGMLALWALAYKVYKKKYPWEDPEARLLQIPLNEEDKERAKLFGLSLYGTDPTKTAYINFAFFSPLVSRGSRALGLAGAFQAHQLGGTAGQGSEFAQRDIYNSLAHPFVSGPLVRAPFVFATGSEPQLTGLRDITGRFRPEFFPAIIKTDPGLKTLAERSKEAVLNVNPFFQAGAAASGVGERGQQATKEGTPSRWLRMATDIVAPRLLGSSVDVVKEKAMMARQAKASESHPTPEVKFPDDVRLELHKHEILPAKPARKPGESDADYVKRAEVSNQSVGARVRALLKSDLYKAMDEDGKRKALREMIKEARTQASTGKVPKTEAAEERQVNLKLKEDAAIQRLKDSPAYKSKTPETQKRMLREEQARWRQPSAP